MLQFQPTRKLLPTTLQRAYPCTAWRGDKFRRSSCFPRSWCGPCRMIGPKIDEMSVEHPDVPIFKVDIDELESLAGEAGVRV